MACAALPAEPSEADLGGMGLPLTIEGERYEGERIPFAAELSTAADGCAYLDFGQGEVLAIWPRGSELSEPVRLADGAELEPGNIVEGLGTIVPFAQLPGGPDGYWAHVTGFCSGQRPHVLVIDEVSEVR